ncbi:unnamed protein product [Allacma fusca]|uniref:Uncharacterized protein n=1 Tax=Allacma fusca TaxID=39272 RepID=A0A8J2PIF8_9HEXA|nr:unnamed protein product [Allacma fusca]
MYSVLRKSAWSEIGFQIGISAKASGSGRTRISKNDAVEKQFMQRFSFLSGFVKSKRSTTENYDLSGNDSEDNASDTLIESQVLSTSDDEVLESNPLNSRESSAPAQSLKTTMRCKKRKINKQDKDVQNRILKVLE